MNVLVLTHSYPRFPEDAAGNFVLRLAQALEQYAGVTSHVIAPAGAGCAANDTIGGIDVHRFRYAPRPMETLAYTGTMAQAVAASWSARLALVGMLGAHFAAAVRERRAFHPDLIHAHWWFPAGLVGSWTAKLSNLPLIITLHGSDVRLARTTSVGRSLGRHVLRSAALVTTASGWLASGAKEIAGDIEPVVAQMPVDTDRFAPASADAEPRWPNRFLFVGRLNEQKGIADAIRAVAASSSDVTLDVVGDSPERDTYVRLAQSLGVAERIHFLGHLPHDHLSALYQRATALLVPSVGEGLGLTAVEAMLCETPVIAYDSGGLPDIVRPGHTGLLVPPGDIPALASAMARVVGQPDEARQLGQAGRLFALSTFSPDAAARRYAALYERIVAHHAG
jgi:glycosyltransferase involved in cell wall biosynthesis